MKYLVTVVTFLVCFSFSTVDVQSKADLTILCATQWRIVSMEINDDKRDLSSEPGEESWMIFHKDGTHEIMSIGQKHIGKWEYKEKSNTIVMTDPTGVVEQKIDKLTKEELILSFTIEEGNGRLFLVSKKEN